LTTVSRIEAGDIDLVFCTTKGPDRIERSRGLRQAAIRKGIPYYTTLVGSKAAVAAIERIRMGELDVRAIQDYHQMLGK
jgi:carbamoyl-phosphate synthase large subunit